MRTDLAPESSRLKLRVFASVIEKSTIPCAESASARHQWPDRSNQRHYFLYSYLDWA